MKSTLLSLALVAAISTASVVVSASSVSVAETDSGVSLTCFPHGAAPTRYDNSWGAARSGGRGHQGVDLMAEKMTPVIAVADGYVGRIRETGSLSGAYVQLVHPGGFESYYMHLNNDTPGTDDGAAPYDLTFGPGIVEGAVVSAGDVIGYVGDSGNAEGSSPHTHFELHIDGVAVNGYDYLVDVDARNTELTDLLAGVGATPTHEIDFIDRGALWSSIVTTQGLECLSEGYENIIEHLFGELPGERVELAGVVAQ